MRIYGARHPYLLGFVCLALFGLAVHLIFGSTSPAVIADIRNATFLFFLCVVGCFLYLGVRVLRADPTIWKRNRRATMIAHKHNSGTLLSVETDELKKLVQEGILEPYIRFGVVKVRLTDQAVGELFGGV